MGTLLHKLFFARRATAERLIFEAMRKLLVAERLLYVDARYADSMAAVIEARSIFRRLAGEDPTPPLVTEQPTAEDVQRHMFDAFQIGQRLHGRVSTSRVSP